MGNFKASLGVVLAILAAIVFGLFCFLGLNFYTMGDTSQSLIATLGIILLIILLSVGAKKFKSAKRNLTNKILEIVFLSALGTVFIFCGWFIFSHYFSVTERKSEIQRKLSKSIDQAYFMFDAYERKATSRLNTYESTLRTVAVNEGLNPDRFREFGFVHGVSIDVQIGNKMLDARTKLFPSTYSYNQSDSSQSKGIKEVAQEWLLKAKDKVNDWKALSTVHITNAIEKNTLEWLNELNKIWSNRIPNEGTSEPSFDYPLRFDDVVEDFTTKSNPPLHSLGIALGLFVFTLLPWIAGERSNKGIITGKGKHDVPINN